MLVTNKKRIADHAERVFEGIASKLLIHRWWVLLFGVCLMAISVYGISKVRVDTSISSIFTPSDPSFVAYQKYLDDFESDEICYILYRGRGKEGVFDYKTMQMIASLTQVFEDEVPFIDEAVSLANIEFMQAVGEDDINVDDLLFDFPEDQSALSELKPKVLAKPNFRNLVISEDGKYAAIVLKMSASRLNALEELKLDPEGNTFSSNLYPSVTFNAVRDILSRDEYNNYQFYLTGDVSINAERNRIVTVNNVMIVLIALVVVVLLSMFFFNATIVGVLGPLLVVVMSILVTVGLMGFQGWAIGIFFGMVPTLLCAIGVAQSAHILIDYQRVLIATHDRNQAITEAIRKVGGACLLAATTTAVSFLVMSVSEMQSMRELALYAAFGIMATFVLSIAVLVVSLSRSEAKSKVETNLYKDFSIHNSVNSLIEAAIQHNRRYQNGILIFCAILGVLAVMGLTRLQVQVELIEDFKPSVQVRQDTEFVEDKMSGNASLVYLIDTQNADGIKDPAFLNALEKLQNYANSIELVRDSRSINNVIKELNQSFNQDQSDYFILPETRELISQYLLVYEFSGGEQISDFVSADYAQAALKLRLAMASSQEISKVIEKIDDYLVENPLPEARVDVTGMGLLWVKIGEYVINTQITSYLLVFAMIAIFVSIVFGSLKVGLVSMIPNLGPIMLCMGAMGWLGTPLDHYKIMLGTIALGIAVDDTIHLVTRFRTRFIKHGNYDKAMARCLRDVGPALVITTLILVGSFSTFFLSDMQTLASFGILLASSIILALLADLYLMPCLITQLKLFGPEFETEQSDVEDIFLRFDASRESRMKDN